MKKIIQISSGRGPAECCLLVSKALKELLAEARNCAVDVEVITRQKGVLNGTLVSTRVQCKGHELDLDRLLKSWIGTVQWTVKSPYRKYHKRKNWFISVQEIISNNNSFSIRDNEIRFEAIRSGGPGGQHVNKVSTAIRAIHVGTGIQVLCSESRSQLQNRKKAKERLIIKIAEREQLNDKLNESENWQQHNELKRGSPVRHYKGTNFVLQK